MRFASFLSTSPDPHVAAAEIAEQLAVALPTADLLLVFATAHHMVERSELVARLSAVHPHALVVGCEGGGVLGSGLEVEGSPGVTVVAAMLPGVTLDVAQLDQDMLLGPEATAAALAPLRHPELRGLLVLSDPYTFDLAEFLPPLQAVFPDVPVFGGQASGRPTPGPHHLVCRGDVVAGGAVVVGLSGRVAIETIVAQGCRPVGPPMFVTRCQKNVALELDGRSPVDVLREVYEALPPTDQERFRAGQYLGIQMRDQTEYDRGDFVIRHVLGVPEGSTGLAVAAPLEQYQVVQLHVRDAHTSHEDLVEHLAHRRTKLPAGALLFTCLGRGRGLYGEPHHDSRCFLDEVGEVALGGFFANGELGPVRGTPFVHGYTSVIVLFSTP